MSTVAPPDTLHLLRAATELVTEPARHGSPSMLMRRIRQTQDVAIGFETARALLTDLGTAGIVGPWNRETHDCPVLLDRPSALEALNTYIQSGTPDWWTLYECPACFRVASWTDGRMVSAGDDIDEFWCQHCGTEVPLSSCAVVSAA